MATYGTLAIGIRKSLCINDLWLPVGLSLQFRYYLCLTEPSSRTMTIETTKLDELVAVTGSMLQRGLR
jgi:hypothetical protein